MKHFIVHQSILKYNTELNPKLKGDLNITHDKFMLWWLYKNVATAMQEKSYLSHYKVFIYFECLIHIMLLAKQ